MDNAVDIAADFCKGMSKFADAVGESLQTVSNWRTRGVPKEKCPSVERVTQGLVTCEALRVDLTWYRVTDLDWPWHPSGKPLLDVAATEREKS